MMQSADAMKGRLVIKAVRNVRKGLEEDEAGRGMYRPGIKLDLQRSRLITESYRQTEGRPMVLRRALALEHILTNMDIYIQDWEKIVGNAASSPSGLYFGIDMNWRSVMRVVNSKEGRDLLDDDGREELAGLADYWKGRSMSDIHQEVFSGEILKYWKLEGTFLWTHWAELGIPDYEKVFRVGLKGIIEQAGDKLAELDREVPRDYAAKKEFLQAVVIALKSVVAFSNRYARKAREMAIKAGEPADRQRLTTIADICSRVPENPPQTLHEALQSFFILHVLRYLEYSTVGIGVRFDKVFGPFYERDLQQQRITRDEALELLQLLWVKFHELGLIYSPTVTSIYGGAASLQAVTIGGVDELGRDVTNDMTYLVLDTAGSMQSLEPSIALRYHDRTPDSLLDKAVDLVSTGIGYPSFFNDKALLPMLGAWGVPASDARDYAVTGCVYMEIPGKNIARRVIGGISLPKCLWWALHQGMNPLNNEQWGAPTPDPRTFATLNDVIDAYLEQVRYFYHRINTIEQVSGELYEHYLPRPYYSALLEGCIDRARESRAWAYPSQVHPMCIMLGTTNVADSIAAIKKVVFDGKKLTMEDLIDALDRDFAGCDDVRRMLLNAPKYGNDDDYADDIAAEIHHRTQEVVASFTNRWGCRCRGDGSALSATYAAGAVCPATPDGRKSGESFADATLSPSQGRDTNGPTAVLKSASKIDTVRTYNHLLNQKFLPSMFEQGMRDRFLAYLRTWGDLGIAHIQFNVVERATLVDAQQHPEKYPDLIVRVAGYSAYFVDLSRGLQNSIISRTEQSF